MMPVRRSLKFVVQRFAKAEKEITVPAKYVYLDIVGFTHGRSVESQSYLVDTLNRFVRCAIRNSNAKGNRLILLPTGDGVCVVILDKSAYDVHILIGLDILDQVEKHNSQTQNDMHKFHVRIGINENVDNLVNDINDRMNIAGAGINMGRRIMDLADDSQILVGQTVYETLRQRDKYPTSFRSYQTHVKHGVTLTVYQFVASGHPGLNVNIPDHFAKPAATKLSELAAYYMAHAMKNRDFFIATESHKRRAASVQLYFLAMDSVNETHTTQFSSPYNPMTLASDSGTEEQFKQYDALPFWINAEFQNLVSKLFSDYSTCFVDYLMIFVSDEGKNKLKTEQPNIWSQFELDKYA